MNRPLLLDNSAWSRLRQRKLTRARATEVEDALVAGAIFVCLPFLLEAGYSARTEADHRALLYDLSGLPRAEMDVEVEDRALDAQAQLARSGHHRLPPADLLMAAIADRHGLGILHYDADYDVIAERTDLRFDGVWLAERGSL